MAGRMQHIRDEDSLRAFLKSHNLKATPQRLAVHEAMCALGHAGVDSIAEYIEKKSGVRITAASIYNVLAQFTELGLYTQRMSMESKMIFDVNTIRHIHLYDSKTGELIDIPDEGLIEEIESALRKRRFRGYRTDRVELSIICHSTRKKRKVL